MKAGSAIRRWRQDAGIALLISIFILLLISVVAIALIVSAGTESALAGNYRNATAVYYAALAGLEEGRGRLSAKNSNSFANTAPGFLPPPGTPLPNGSPIYIINPAGGETVAPWDPTSLYPDNEFNQEFGSSGFSLPNPSPSTPSLSTVAGIQGPMYKWVRINAVSEESLNLDVSPFDGILSHTKTVFYDGTRLNDTDTGGQVLEITALAVLPNGSQKLLQYLVAPVPINLPIFPAAVTLAGNNVNYDGPNSASFFINGIDTFRNPFGLCTPGAPQVYAIGYTNGGDGSHGNIDCCVMVTHSGNYIGQGGSSPNVHTVTVQSALQTFLTPNDYNGLVTTITPYVDVPPIIGPATGSNLPATMSPTNPMTILVQGDLDLTGWHNAGYGLLVVTGNLTYDPGASWYGVVMVIGKGVVTGPATGGSGEFDGAVLVVQTKDPVSGAPLGTLGQSKMSFDPNMGGLGIYYSSCWINNALPTTGYKVLSFHEISQ